MTKPLISIITPCLNRADFVDGAVRSVLDQGYANFEHLVMDAGSTDGTLDLLRAYPHLRVTSEPDHGMYDAINKGIRAARGEIIGLLNTDDRYAPGAFRAVAEAFLAHPDCQAVVGGAEFLQLDGGQWSVVEHVPAIPAHDLWRRIILGNPISNAWCFRRQVFEQGGAYDDRFRWVADRYFLIRVALDAGVRPLALDQVLYQYLLHSGSVTLNAGDSRIPKYGHLRLKVLSEEIQALEEFMRREKLPAEPRRWMRRAHAELTYRLVATAAYHHDWALAMEFTRRGWGRNPAWPFVFLDMALHRLKRGFGAHD